MQQFETLLLRQLQKQQIRDEFCDTVLHTQGVSVPVHSCVLSAFSPRFYGTLSSMPVPMAGQRRLIELQAVDGCTLLSLVSLLYSGQLQENREQVLSAAQRLGIELPQWEEEERREGKVGRRKAREDADQENKIESGTQTEREEKTDERGAQTDLASSKPQTMYLINPSTCPANQELGSCVDIQDVALPLQVIHPERISITCDSSAMAPGTEDSHPVTDSAHLSQIYLYSSETSHHQTSTSVTLPPHNSILDQSVVVPAAGADDLKQFEGNIPGFINYFLDSTESPNIGRRGHGCAKERLKEAQVVKSARAKSTARDSGREWIRWTAGVKGGRRQRHMERWGLVARLAWRGQGGGKVGRLLETRSTGKNRMRALQRRQVREALVEAGAARGRGRHRQRGKTGTVAGSEEQNESPSKRRSSGRRRVTPLPPASRSFSTTTTTKLNTVDTSELDLLHTMAPVLVNQIEPIQPIDTLLEDIMTGLHFLPPAETQTIQHGLMSTTTSSSPPILKASNSKPTDPKQHMEGELGDILDHFLRTFDHNSQVGCCGLDVGGETSQGSNKPDSGRDTCSNTSKRFTQQQPYNPHINNQKPQANCLHTSSTLSTQPQSMMNSSVAKKKHVKDGQKRGSKQRNPSRDQNIVQEFENRRLTRSQTKKRKLETALFTHQNPVKRKCNEKERADTRKKRQSDDQKRPKYKAYVDKSGVKKLKDSQKQVRAGERRQRETRFSRNKSVKNRSCRMDDCKQKKSPPKKSLSVGIHWEKNAGNRGLVKHQGFSGAEGRSEEIPEAKDEERINVNGTVKGQERVNYKLKLRQRREDSKRTGDRARQEEMATEESSVPFQLNLPTDTAKRNSYIFHLPKEGIKDTKASISTTESVAKVLDAWPGGPVSAEVKLPFTQSIMLRMTDLALDVGDAPQLASASRLSHAQPRQELLRSLTSVDEEEEDVDVVEVSSTTSELPAVSILEVDLSTEDEVEEDCEIDVLGLDSPCRTASANPGLHTVPRPAEI